MKKNLFISLILVLLSGKILFAQKKHVKLYSKDSIENTTLENIKITKSEPTTKEKLLEKIKLKGYFYSYIDSTYQIKDTVFHRIYLGKRINFLKLKTPEELNYLKSIIPELNYEKIKFSKFETILTEIENQLSKEGKGFSTIQLTNIDLKDNLLVADLTINKSEKRIIDNIIIKGYDGFPKNYLNHFAKIKKGDLFDKNKINDLAQNIDNLKFVKTTNQPEALFKKDSTTLYLYLEEVKRNNFDGLLNFSTNPSNDKVQITGNLNLELVNLLNTGEELNFSWNANGNESQNINLSTKIPYIFNTPISNHTSFEIHKQDSTFLNSKLQTNFTYTLNPRTEIGTFYETESSNNTLNNNITSIENFNTNFVGLSFSYHIPNNHSIYKTKLFLLSKYQFGQRSTTNSTGNQSKINLEAYYLFEINQRNSVFVRSESNLLLSNTFLTNELFRIGGPNSIRGVNQQSIFTAKYSFMTLEYRILANKDSYIYSITDFGIIESTNKIRQNLLTLGAGYSFFINKSKIDLIFSGNLNATESNSKGFNLSLSFKNYF
ncbi:hypothetical protein [Tenacibaculum sp. 190524A05c]|uniref:hypothetical protein n=1 Tax=Tenacibaculum platacis TaxID=3137852 RepID=UPI0032B15C3C